MFSYTELRGQSTLDKHGSIELNTSYVTARKPLWLVALKLAVLGGMVTVGAAVLIPLLAHWLPLWKSGIVSAGILLIYIGVAFFCRPQYNGDNMGWFGGMANDPFQYSDNVNRLLFQLHMFLGPGRFAAETLLDACALLDIAGGPEVEETEPAAALEAEFTSCGGDSPAVIPVSPRPDRFDPSGGDDAWR